MLVTIWDIARVTIETISENHPELIRDDALVRQIREDCEKLETLAEEGLVCCFGADPMGDGGNFEVKLFFTKGAEYSEANRILGEILPHAVRLGVCTDEDSDCREDGEEIHLGIRWDYPPVFQSPEK